MKIKQCTSLFVVVLAACPLTNLGYQKVDLSGMKPPTRTEQQPVEFITPEELKTKIAKNEAVAIIDIRSPRLYAESDRTIKGAVHTKVRRVAHRLREIPRDRDIVTYCACPNDEASSIAARALLGSGFKRVRVLKGGWNAWIQAGGPVQPKPKSS